MKIYNVKHLKLFKQADLTWLLNEDIEAVTSCLKKPWRFVGGCVRDSLMGQQTTDIDIVTISTPDEIKESLKGFNLITIGAKYGTIGVFYQQWNIEITTTRIDITTFGRKAEVDFTTSFKEDSNRRDFSINALLFNKHKIYDYHNGVSDLKQQRIKFIKNPQQRIKEDFLRIIRYIRFYIKFSNKKLKYIQLFTKYLNNITILSIERIIGEINKMCQYENTAKGIEIMNNLGICELIFKQKLNTKLDLNIDKMVQIFLFYDNYSKLPLAKTVKWQLKLAQTRHTDIFKHTALVWNNTKTIENATMSVKLQEIKQNKDFTNILKQIQKPIQAVNTDAFSGILLGKLLLLQKYFHLIKEPFKTDNIENTFQQHF